jgi:NAD(P)H dehydrogenase (quinone)
MIQLFNMNTILVILGHPSEKSFNHAIAETVINKLTCSGYIVCYHDLYKEDFNAVLSEYEIPKNGICSHNILNHCNELKECDGIIVIHPNWWGQPPAVVKGWIDKVFRPGIAYEFLDGDNGEGIPKGLLKAKFALVFNTSNTSEERENIIFGDPLETIWKNCIFGLCGVQNFYRKVFNIIINSTEEIRKEWLVEVEKIVEQLCPTRKVFKD